MKKDVFKEGKQGKILSTGELLMAAGIAGMPSAALTTPFDVVKTRLQVGYSFLTLLELSRLAENDQKS